MNTIVDAFGEIPIPVRSVLFMFGTKEQASYFHIFYRIINI